ncbi:hypothetical protein ACPEEZ_04790 [Frigoribacterium sp. 2-23]|uniref:hypothetical protein n=1 Tax=Frigoribacterium sp. 2-23 TaxID=3415006 RepID=UPI003C6F7D90
MGRSSPGERSVPRMGLIIALIVVGVILLILGVAVKAAMFLLYIGIALLLIGAIWWLMKYIRSRA